MMCLSTGHVSALTAESISSLFNLGVPPKWAQRLTAYPHGEYGWLICIAGDVLDHMVRESVDVEMPEELLKVIRYADERGCEWLLLDRDAELIDDLPEFDW